MDAPARPAAAPARPGKEAGKEVHRSFHVSLLPAGGEAPRRRLAHLAVYSKRNAGDHLLPVTLRDLFDAVGGRSAWQLRNVRPLFEEDDVAALNACDGVVLGGGGLFLRDRNPNANSGWQWNCPIPLLDAIRPPLVVFAVGYNRFRGQPEFDPVFRDHIARVAEKSVYLGLRNAGSMRAIRGYLPPALHHKVRFQPCMTTLVAKLYPHLVVRPADGAGEPLVALNMAFDRAELRYGPRELEVLVEIARAMKALSARARIHLVLQGSDDDHMAPFLRGCGVPFERVDLRTRTPAEIVQYYAGVDLAIGMRGHAQMIPFGCGTPILSLVSHDKLQWFLDDLGRPDWGVEVLAPDVQAQLVDKARAVLDDAAGVRAQVLQAQDRLWEQSVANVRDAIAAMSRP